MDVSDRIDSHPDTRTGSGLEILLILVLFFVAHGDLPPDVNEAHYLAKAKHYWNPNWCPEDHFLQSADAHLVFYWTLGWLTQWVSLPVLAWIGRLAAWTLLAVGWLRLSRTLLPRPGLALLTAAAYLLLLQYTHLAGEWVVGGVEAKGFAYGLVFLGLEAVVMNRWCRGWLLLGTASAFHVLVGGWATVAVALAWWVAPANRPSLKTMLPFLILGGCLALPGLLPAIALTSGVSSADVALANDIYVYHRLSHHLVVSAFASERIFSHLGILVSWLLLLAWCRRYADDRLRRLQGVVIACVLVGLTGALLGYLVPRSNPMSASLLRYYWFRLSDAMLPVGVIFAVARLLERAAVSWPRMVAYKVSGLIVLITAMVAMEGVRRYGDPRPAADRQALPTVAGHPEVTRQVYLDWVQVCSWIRQETPQAAVFLTPRRQQTFKWYAHRAEIVSWKDIPQDARGLIQWHERFSRWYWDSSVESGFTSLDPQLLVKQMKHHGARYLVRPNLGNSRRLPLRRVYPLPNQNSYYEVYERVP